MTYAIIETGGKQLLVEPGRFYNIERLHVEAESDYTVDKVLLVNHENDVTIGHPLRRRCNCRRYSNATSKR